MKSSTINTRINYTPRLKVGVLEPPPCPLYLCPRLGLSKHKKAAIVLVHILTGSMAPTAGRWATEFSYLPAIWTWSGMGRRPTVMTSGRRMSMVWKECQQSWSKWDAINLPASGHPAQVTKNNTLTALSLPYVHCQRSTGKYAPGVASNTTFYRQE